MIFVVFLAPIINNENDENKEDTNVFLSSSLQQSSPPIESPSKDEDQSNIIKETIDQTISTIVLEEESEPIPSNVIKEEEEEKQIVSSTPSSSLNPDAIPFFAPIEDDIKKEPSISTGDESDDEVDSNDTPISSG